MISIVMSIADAPPMAAIKNNVFSGMRHPCSCARTLSTIVIIEAVIDKSAKITRRIPTFCIDVSVIC